MMTNTISSRRLELITQIDHLQKRHPSLGNNHSCPDPECEICPQIRELGKQYEMLTVQKRQRKRGISQKQIEKKAKEILSKGKDAKKSEIEFLINVAKMPKREIGPKLGMNQNTFLEICKMWGLGQINKRKSG